MYTLDKNKINNLPIADNFHLRGLETTRLDTFIDAAFAFATTMLVISVGNIPNNFSELLLALKAIPSFLASFASVVFIWLGHRKWSRRYGIENTFTIIISFGLVFVLMIYIYPLRLVFSSLFAWISSGFFPSEFVIASYADLSSLFIFYGLGFAAISALLGILFLYAYNKGNTLYLTEIENILTQYEYKSWFVMSSTAFLSAVFAIVMPLKIAIFAGFFYILLPILMPSISIYFNKKIKQIESVN